MIIGSDQIERFGQQRERMIVWVIKRADHVADIDLVIGKCDLLASCANVAQAHIDMRMRLLEARHRPGHEFGRGKGHVGDAQCSGLSLGDQPRG